MISKAYYLCSEELIKRMNPKEVSRPLEWKYSGKVYTAALDIDEVQKIFNTLNEEESYNFWCRQAGRAWVSCESFHLDDARELGLFDWIMEKFDIGAERNVAAVIGEISFEMGITPIELFDELSDI